jgi:hypothetical protein
LTLFFIAFLPALVVFCIGVMSQSKIKLLIATIVACFIGLKFGSPKYAVIDLFAIAIAYWLGLTSINNDKPFKTQTSEANITSFVFHKLIVFAKWLIFFSIVLIIYANLYKSSSVPIHLQNHNEAPQIEKIQQMSPDSETKQIANRKFDKNQTNEKSPQKNYVDSKQLSINKTRDYSEIKNPCLDLPTDSEILECLD